MRGVDRHPVALVFRGAQQAPEQWAERCGEGRGGPVHPLVRQGALTRVVQVPALLRTVFGAQVADDGVGLPQGQVAVFEHRHQAVGVAGTVVRLVDHAEGAAGVDRLEIQAQFVGDP
ncbi:hypothetical protein D3C75_819000 [compost metagenome]